ncbi:glycosyltransferase [Candidatus Roizmanbacteria bacterium]|nr:glycosyltransferase [Candidatus Roizmanbacteria bacterium]
MLNKVSLIIPCYNEEANIQKGVLDKIGNFTKNDDRFREVLIINDGSSDSTKKIIKDKYLKLFPKFTLIENNHQGKAFAIITGIQEATSEYVIFSDIDLATPLEEVDKLYKAMENNYDIAIGSRNPDRRGAPLSRKIMARGYMIIRDMLIGLNGIKDTQCGFKMFKRDVALNLLSRIQVFHTARKTSGPSVSAGFDLEFLFLATKLGYKIKEVSVVWRHVETKNVNFFHDALETLKDILRIKYYDLRRKYDV